MRRQRGLTLLEVMVALTIFALIGVASYQVLASAVTARDIQQRHRTELAELQRSLWILQRDVEQWQRREVRSSNANQPIPALMVEENGARLRLTSSGRRNPLELQQSPLLRLRYRLAQHPEREDSESPYYQDEKLYLLREVWFDIDGLRAEPADLIQALLPGSDFFSVEVLTDRGRYRSWPPAKSNSTPPEPKALIISLEHPRYGKIERWLALP